MRKYTISCRISGTVQIENVKEKGVETCKTAIDFFENCDWGDAKDVDLISIKKEGIMQITGCFECTVEADTSKEALELADDEFDVANFGDLEEIIHAEFVIVNCTSTTSLSDLVITVKDGRVESVFSTNPDISVEILDFDTQDEDLLDALQEQYEDVMHESAYINIY